jgi:hypothetical protein
VAKEGTAKEKDSVSFDGTSLAALLAVQRVLTAIIGSEVNLQVRLEHVSFGSVIASSPRLYGRLQLLSHYPSKTGLFEHGSKLSA